MGVDELYLGKTKKFVTVVSNLECGEPVWFGQDRKKTTLDEFFSQELSRGQRSRIVAACVDMWAAFKSSTQLEDRQLVIHEMMHTLGAGHGCAWPSVQT